MTNHWCISFLGKFVWTNAPESFSKVTLVLVHGWLFPIQGFWGVGNEK